MVVSDTERVQRGHLVGDKEVRDNESISVVNPATAKEFGTVPAGDSNDVNTAVRAAREGLAEWQALTPAERGRALKRAAERVRSAADDLAALLVRENGKSRSAAETEVEIAARYFEYYAGSADKLEGESIPLDREHVDFTVREPLGVTAHVIPWNFPVILFARTVAPALAAGNATVIKPAEQTPLTANALVDLVHDAGVPVGALNFVHGYGPDVGAPLAGHADVDGIAFTGSVPTGQEVAKRAVENFNPVHVEAGGKNPNVVFPDADLDAVVAETLPSIFTFNAGQVCSAGDRLIVHEDVHGELVEKLRGAVAELSVGPGESDPDVGAIVSEAQFERVVEYVELGREEAGDPVVVGSSLNLNGYFVEPTVFDGVTSDMRIAQEEIFDPVLAVMIFSDEAVELANDTQYGLVAGVHTSDLGRAHRFARDVDAGQVYINEWFAGGVETPFGGYGKSGFGREKGQEALSNFTQTKNVCLAIDDLE